jgi:hypothetical protein
MLLFFGILGWESLLDDGKDRADSASEKEAESSVSYYYAPSHKDNGKNRPELSRLEAKHVIENWLALCGYICDS